MTTKKCGDCIHAEICKKVNSGWFSPKNIAYCTAFKERKNCVVWIPLSERVPDTKGTYLVCTDKFGIVLAHWYGDRFGGGRASNHVTHWMPLPEPPME